MNPAEKAAVTVEAARKQQVQQGQGKAQSRKISSRNDMIIFISVLVLAVLSVVALVMKGGK
jgi:hypothetical protein